MGYYGFVFPSSNGLLKTSSSILFCVLLAFTIQVLLGLFTKNQRHLGLALLSSFFLLDVWSLTRFAENEPLMSVLFGTPDKEPLIGALGVLGLIFAISVLWYTPERPYPRWRGILNTLISITGLIGLLHMQKTGFAAWHPMASIAVYAAWLLCLSEMLLDWLKRLVVALKVMLQRIKTWLTTVFYNCFAFVRSCYQWLCAWMLGILTSVKQRQKSLAAWLLAFLKRQCQQLFRLSGRCWKGFCNQCEVAKQLLLKLLAHLVKGILYIMCHIMEAAAYIGYHVAVCAIAAVLWSVDRCRQYYPPLKKHTERLLYAAIAKLRAMWQ